MTLNEIHEKLGMLIRFTLAWEYVRQIEVLRARKQSSIMNNQISDVKAALTKGLSELSRHRIGITGFYL